MVEKNLVHILADQIAFNGADIALIKAYVDTLETYLTDPTYGLAVIAAYVDTLETLLTDATYGLSALETLVDEVESLLKNATYGLSALKTEIDANETKIDRKVSCMTFWSDVSTINPIQLTTPAADKDLPNVVVANIPSGSTIVQAMVLIKIRAIENKSSSGYNAINGAQNIRIKVSTGAWGTDDIAAINLIDNQWYIAASTREFGDVQVGDNDVKSVVTGNATYNLRFEDALVDYATLDLFDVQAGIRVWFY